MNTFIKTRLLFSQFRNCYLSHYVTEFLSTTAGSTRDFVTWCKYSLVMKYKWHTFRPDTNSIMRFR